MVLSSGSWWRRARSREDGGYEGFTIAAVCERARVAPTALYARITPKNALFLAVYEHEHGIARLRVEQEVFADEARWTGLAPAELVRTAVAEMVGISLRHERFLRAVVLVSATHAEVRRRGSGYGQALGEGFAAVVLRVREAIRHDDPEAAVRTCFGTVFPRRLSGWPTAPTSPHPSRSATTRSSPISARRPCATCWPAPSAEAVRRRPRSRRRPASGAPGRAVVSGATRPVSVIGGSCTGSSLNELRLEVVGQRLEPECAVLACSVVDRGLRHGADTLRHGGSNTLQAGTPLKGMTLRDIVMLSDRREEDQSPAWRQLAAAILDHH